MSNQPSLMIVKLDPWLESYTEAITQRYKNFLNQKQLLENTFGSLDWATSGHHYFGFNRGEDLGKTGWWYREWAPSAVQLNLIGDFNNWDRTSHPMTCDSNGVWSIFLPDNPNPQLLHLQHLKVHVLTHHGARDRIPAYIKRVAKTSDGLYTGQIWQPNLEYQWQNSTPIISSLKIYETHVGMAQEEPKIGTFSEFIQNILPRIHQQGYNAIQLMAIMQHPYYGSFGYQVSNFFAVTNDFGSPDELKQLIDQAHKLGIIVLLDVVHSHAVKNYDEGLNNFDGSDGQYFHSGARGLHPNWDTRLFNYGSLEVLRFLLSNLRFWIEEYHFDGFRFDGVTSMIYNDHGHRNFNSYDDYFNSNLDPEAISYLQLANYVIHHYSPNAITVAEEVSGLPGLALPIDQGGVGFDYRLAMGIPDFWIKLLKHTPDEEWSVTDIYNTLINRRQHEKHIAYAESHDQAMVGDKTIAFWLMDSHMYHKMDLKSQDHLIDRGIALHKLLRLVTYFLGGESWLNFMGNEFGHPEWIDFPREGNNFSYFYARRQWSLVDNKELKYQYLNNFDKDLNYLDSKYNFLNLKLPQKLLVNDLDKIIAVEKNANVLLINLHPEHSYQDYSIPWNFKHATKVIDTDNSLYGGWDRIQTTSYPIINSSIKVYLPSRTAIVISTL